MIISFIAAEETLRSNDDSRPGVVAMSTKAEHGYGSFVLNTAFEPIGKSGMVPVGPDAPESQACEVITAEELVDALAGSKELLYALHMLHTVASVELSHAFANGKFVYIRRLVELGEETATAVHLRWPNGVPDPE